MASRDTSGRSRRATLGTVATNPRLAGAFRGFGGYCIAEHGGWLAILLFAYQQGGTREAGVVVTLLLVPAAIISPLVGTIGDRFSRQRVLASGFIAAALMLALTGVSMIAEWPKLVSYGLAVGFSILATFSRPTLGGLIPAESTGSDQLTAANVAVGLVDTSGALAGPALTALLVIDGTPGRALVVLAALAGLTALTMIPTARTSTAVGQTADDPVAESPFPALLRGFRLLRDDRSVRSLVLSIAAPSMLVGAVDVGAIVLALDVLGDQESVAGLLTMAFGLGAVIGSISSVTLVGRQRLARSLIRGVLVASVAFAILGQSESLLATIAFLIIAGAGLSLAEIAARTMIQGLTSDDTLSRLFGVLESAQSIGLAAGGLTVSLLTVAWGPGAAFACVGAAVALGALATSRRLAGIDRARRPVSRELDHLLRSTSVFGALPPYAIEQLCRKFEATSYESATAILRRDEPGHLVGVVSDGSIVVDIPDRGPVEHGRGSLVGEIAVLRAAPRSADVSAGNSGAVIYWIDGTAFLNAISAVPRSKARAHAQASRRLGASGNSVDDDQRP